MKPTISYEDGAVVMIDQRKLPTKEVYNRYKDYLGIYRAIKTMVIRGAPAIGVAAAMGYALAAGDIMETDYDKFKKRLDQRKQKLASARPTAVNLFWALERMSRKTEALKHLPVEEIKLKLWEEAIEVDREDYDMCRKIGMHGGKLLNDGDYVLTHCNAGGLATAGYGTALGVIRGAIEQNKRIHVYADETRPFLQGARLTAWELHNDNIPVTLICDNMAGYMMSEDRITSIVVGSDRIASNGDVANKIGTMSVAILARHFGIPFYVAAPTSTIDMNIDSGKQIPIEERDTKEITTIARSTIAPEGICVCNPAFDVTPNELVSAIITEKGVARAPYRESLAAFFRTD